MTIGPDIKEVYEEVGTAFTILRTGGDVAGGHLHFNLNRQVTKPFIREFFVEAFFAYDTGTQPGEVLKFDTTADVYLVMNKTPQLFEDEIIQYHGVLYKCNVSGELQRPSGEAEWDTDYRKQTVFETLESECYALQTEALYGHDLDTDEELGMLGVENHELYLSASWEIRQLDRYVPVSGENFRVDVIKKRRYPAVDVAELSKDTR